MIKRLSGANSPYLRHAADQKIEWYPWSAEAFERAALEDKPVFLSTGAVWCHWCHVMAKESFENDEIAQVLNEHFVCIKLDRDERPDIDRRYQKAVAAMNNRGGWPLSVFLTPDMKPFFGGTYFPPEDSHGRPGFKKVLLAVYEFYRDKRGEVADYSSRLMEYLKPGPGPKGKPDRSLVDKAVADIMSDFDPKNGGFGTAPKFPMPGALELLMSVYFLSGNEAAGDAVLKTLTAMAKGGFHDQLKGGFHRYSVDEAWTVPHFEKMADDNSWLLRNYASAYAVFGDPYFRAVAEGIIRFLTDVLSSADGGFYASQDADVTPDDEGGYFTWSDPELRAALDDEEYRVLSLHYMSERGSMHHDSSRKVLCISSEPVEIAEKTGIELKRVIDIISAGREKLLLARDMRTAPYVDRTLYSSLNGMLITAYLQAYTAFGDPGVKAFGLKSLEKVMKTRFNDAGLLHSEGVSGVLDDYVFVAEALISAYEVTADTSYLESAEGLMMICIDKFYDRDSGGFFDTDSEVLGLRLKAVEDIPHPSANSVAVRLLLKLFHMTGKEVYYKTAEDCLGVFSEDAMQMGVHAGHYFSSLYSYFNMVKLTLGVQPGKELAETATRCFHPYKSLLYEKDTGTVLPCLAGGVCLEPISEPGQLREFLRHPG